MAKTQESDMEDLVEAHLLQHGYVTAGRFDPQRGLVAQDLLDYVELANPKAWAALTQSLGDKLAETVLDSVGKEAQSRGLLHVLRHGVKCYGKTLSVATFAPASGLNPGVQALYAANKLAVARQVHHNPKAPEKSVDVVLFLNGIPLATAELKNKLTDQTVHHAVAQYKRRDPNVPLFRPNQGALIHFAVGSDEVHMTTALRGAQTRFLPFNRGAGTGAGNPPEPDKHRTFYLWEQVWARDSLLDLVGHFMTLPDRHDKRRLVSPRYHQLDAVRALVEAAKTNGAGTNYLVQHSTGSGKSNTIAWLAHRLATLHDDQDRQVFDKVIVITDRVVLDSQLQETISQVDHREGFVQRIDKDSQQLAQQLATPHGIVISTLHKFGFIADQVANLGERRYAILVDEAHSSQSGDMAKALKEILGSATLPSDDDDPADADDADHDQLLRAAVARGPQPNLSYVAFTATPKAKTLELFGQTRGGKPRPFHLYSMRQAIEEGFVLDVLQGYTTYERYYKLVKKIGDDPKLDKRQAARALARFVDLHPSNVAAKVEVIVEHFRRNVLRLLGGQAKAMVVTASRLMAVRYKRAFDAYMKKQRYTDLGVLVAFSGSVVDPDLPETKDAPYTEPGLNGFAEAELPGRFDAPGQHVLIVANKYQTGFDQPKLCAMYVDRALGGIQAVQTLSRLNRSFEGKDRVFVLDFRNTREEIQRAFQDYYEATTVDEVHDPAELHRLEGDLWDARVFEQSEVDRFAKTFFKAKAQQRARDNGALCHALDPACDRFRGLSEDAREAFRSTLGSYCNLYGFLAQVHRLESVELETLYVFGRALLKALPKGTEGAAPVDLSEDVALQYLRLRQTGEASIELDPQGEQALGAPQEGGGGKPESVEELLSNLIKTLNDLHETDFDAQDLVDAVAKSLLEDADVQQKAQANDEATFVAYLREGALDEAIASKHEENEKFTEEALTPGAFREDLHERLSRLIYRRLTERPVWPRLCAQLVSRGYTHSRLRGRKGVEPWRPAARTAEEAQGLLEVAWGLARSPMPATFEGTPLAPADRAGLGENLRRLFDFAEALEEEGLRRDDRKLLASASALILEPFCARLLAELAPEPLTDQLLRYQQKRRPLGLSFLLELLRQEELGGFEEELFKLDPKHTDGWEGLGTVSNAIRDLLERRNEESHRSPDPSNEDVAQQTWGTLVVILELVGRNRGALEAALGVAS